MYKLFRYFKWNPLKYYAMSEGEKTFVRAFLSQYEEEKLRESEEIAKAAGS